MDDSRIAAIRAIAEPILAEQQAELVELTSRLQGRQLFLKFLVDAVGGVTIQQCARINHRIGLALETANIIEDSFIVEVSSPGLDRPLANLRDYERAVGEQIQVDVEHPDAKVRQMKGMLLAVQPEAIVLKTNAGNVTVALTQIRAAKKALPW